MRRREVGGNRQHELVDSGRWPLCDRFDGETQPCLCWIAQQQDALAAARRWPGGNVTMFTDWLEVVQQYQCQAPFGPSRI